MSLREARLLTWLNPRNALIVMALALATFAYGEMQYYRGKRAMRMEVENAAFVHYKAEAERLNALAKDLDAALEEVRNAEPKIVEKYQRVVVEKPLPSDCRIDPDRLLNINAAVQAANAANTSKPMPNHPGGQKR